MLSECKCSHDCPLHFFKMPILNGKTNLAITCECLKVTNLAMAAHGSGHVSFPQPRTCLQYTPLLSCITTATTA